MTRKEQRAPTEYSVAGVDEEREQTAFASVMRPWLKKTKTLNKRVNILAGIMSGHFATVLQIDGHGPAIALTTDGVGTKILVARAAERYETVGIDCVANNVNDLVCIGADPVALLDYIAIDVVDEIVLEALAKGLYQGAREAGISIPGGEIAQVAAMLAPASDHPQAPMFDLVGTAIGLLPETEEGRKPTPLDGSDVEAGDIVIGLRSSGLHSNGYSLARYVLFEKARYSLSDTVPGSGQTLADELLAPTRIYVKTIRNVWGAKLPLHGLVNISGGGLLNLLRLNAKVGYRIDNLPEPAPIFQLIRSAGEVPVEQMYATFNMGVGACAVVPPRFLEEFLVNFKESGEDPIILGETTETAPGSIDLTALGLRGTGDSFHPL